MVWNALDFPGLVFPVTTVDPVLDTPKPAHDFLSDTDKLIYELCKSNFEIIKLYFHYDVADTPERFKDAPVGLQVLARPQEDEAVLGMGEIIDKALASHKANL